ncbi:MAG: hypothetical protein IPO27_08760 [Bacteroidetes bacterium]|nr:hypothetical protein [Bacteroidota bacterium]
MAENEKHLLSKTSYVKSLQCQKQLYLYKNHYNLRDPLSKETLQKFKRGHDIGRLAHTLFPGGVDASAKGGRSAKTAVQYTKELIELGHQTIFEASFQYMGIWIICDVLCIDQSGWKIFEVKSSRSISSTYLNDAALQYAVCLHASKAFKTEIADFSIIHINAEYVRMQAFDASQFFKTVSVYDHCKAELSNVNKNINRALSTLEAKAMPAIPTGNHCYQPYSCDFMGYCGARISATPGPIPKLAKRNYEGHVYASIAMAQPAMPLLENTQPFQRIPYAITFWQQGTCLFHASLYDTQLQIASMYRLLYTHLSKYSTILIEDKKEMEYLLREMQRKMNENEFSAETILENLVELPLKQHHLSFVYNTNEMTESIFLKSLADNDLFAQTVCNDELKKYGSEKTAWLEKQFKEQIAANHV